MNSINGSPQGQTDRYLWSPVIHRALNEACFYFLFAVDDSRGGRLSEQLHQIFRSLNIRGTTAYVVQGPDDLIVRSWLTPTRRQALLNALNEQQDRLGLISVSEFGADQVDYFWLSDLQIEQQKSLNLRETDPAQLQSEVLSMIDPVTLVPSPSRLPQLTDSGLLIKVTDTSSRRLFAFITYSGESRSRPNSRAHDLLFNVASDSGLGDVTVYRGRTGSFCEFIVKGLIDPDKSAAKREVIGRFQDGLGVLGMNAWTLSPMGVDYIDGSESIDGIRDDDAQLFEEMMSSSASDGIQDIEALRVELANVANVEFIRGFISITEQSRRDHVDETIVDRVQGRILSIIAGLLTKNRRVVNQQASYLVSITADMRDILAHYGADQLDEIGLEEAEPILLSSMAASLVEVLEVVEPDLPVDLAAPHIIRYAETAQRLREEYVDGEFLSDIYGSPLTDFAVHRLDEIVDAAILQMFLESWSRELD